MRPSSQTSTTTPQLYRAEWPILDRTDRPISALKAEAQEDLVVMLHDAGLVPIGKTEFSFSPDRRVLGAVTPVRPLHYGRDFA